MKIPSVITSTTQQIWTFWDTFKPISLWTGFQQKEFSCSWNFHMVFDWLYNLVYMTVFVLLSILFPAVLTYCVVCTTQLMYLVNARFCITAWYVERATLFTRNSVLQYDISYVWTTLDKYLFKMIVNEDSLHGHYAFIQ